MREVGRGFVSLFLHRRWHVTWAIFHDSRDWTWPTFHPDPDLAEDAFRWIVRAGPFELIGWYDGEVDEE
jgi:hypothetical protein